MKQSKLLVLVVGLVVTALLGCDDDGDDAVYLRRYVLRVGGYEPCKNAGFDDAMNVDCESLRESRAAAEEAAAWARRSEHIREYDERVGKKR